MSRGSFVISLDFEIHWGVFDAMALDTYQENLNNVPKVIHKLLEVANHYDIALTFATVGLLFFDSKDNLLLGLPSLKPAYTNSYLNPYELLDELGAKESEDKLHFAKSLIQKIQQHPQHEIGTHTFGHYNCLAEGQTQEQFNHDLLAAIKAADSLNVKLESIVFPKNQVNDSYLAICKQLGITSYRGTEKSTIYNMKDSMIKRSLKPLIRFVRLLDGYVNLTGDNTYDLSQLESDGLINLPSSRFLRPYNPMLKSLEPFKIKRITKAMEHAAKRGNLFHLWWHPHNFGSNIDSNFKNLEKIFKKYAKLKDDYGFQSETMTGLTNKLLQK